MEQVQKGGFIFMVAKTFEDPTHIFPHMEKYYLNWQCKYKPYWGSYGQESLYPSEALNWLGILALHFQKLAVWR